MFMCVIETFGFHMQVIFDFDNKSQRGSPGEVLREIAESGQECMAGNALALAQNALFEKRKHAGTKILVLILSGVPADDVVQPSKTLRDKGVIVYGLGAGDNFGKEQLAFLVTPTVERHAWISDMSQLGNVLPALENQFVAGTRYTHNEIPRSGGQNVTH